MTLYLVRHGEAMRESEDAARPLNARGREEVDRVAAYLARSGARVAEIRHSGKARAQETAERIGRAIGAPAVFSGGLRPDDDPAPVGAAVAAEGRDLMLVGHLPQLARLAELLLGAGARPRVELRTAGLLRLEREGGSWRLVEALSPGTLPRTC